MTGLAVHPYRVTIASSTGRHVYEVNGRDEIDARQQGLALALLAGLNLRPADVTAERLDEVPVAGALRPLAEQERRLRVVVDAFQPQASSVDELDATARYVLVEGSVFDGEHYLTSHASPQGAAEYYNGEYPEDWVIEVLIDLATGQKFYPVQATSFAELPGPYERFDFGVEVVR